MDASAALAASPKAHLYRHFDSSGTLLYVGQSLSALRRLADHEDCSHWFNSIARVHIVHFDSRALALEAEREAIEKEKPLHNILRPHVCPVKPGHIEAEQAKKQLTRTVVFEPLYSVSDLANVLRISNGAVARLWDSNNLGFVVVGRNKKHWKTGRSSPIRMSSGWQLISYIEALSG